MYPRAMIALAIFSLCAGMPGFAPAAGLADAQNLVTAAAQTGMMQAEAAKLALRASTRNAIKEYAFRVIADQLRMSDELATLSRKRQLSLPSALNAEQEKVLQSLRDTPAGSFDAAYLAQAVAHYSAMAGLLQSNLLNVDSELAVFASYNLPRVTGHQQVAEQLQATWASKP